MWLGELITEKGVGNGISLIIFIGIISRLDDGVKAIYNYLAGAHFNFMSILAMVILVAVSLLLVGFVVSINDAERRIPVQYAKRVVGRKMYGGQSTYIPLKVAMAGVMPIIFAMSILSFPATLANLFGQPAAGTFWFKFLNVFNPNGWVYAILYFALIIFFTYFYTSIQFNPIEMSNNIKRNGGFVQGIRPGKPTSDYIAKVLSKVTLIGALAIAIVAVFPIALNGAIPSMQISLGGTSVLIAVSVALETTKQIESQMLMRHYKGFLE
jgi:preprotein translocase subunit SecY